VKSLIPASRAIDWDFGGNFLADFRTARPQTNGPCECSGGFPTQPIHRPLQSAPSEKVIVAERLLHELKFVTIRLSLTEA
jgi:hypothetical protein